MGNATLPSAQLRFTSEFEMESGGSTTLWPPERGRIARFARFQSGWYDRVVPRYERVTSVLTSGCVGEEDLLSKDQSVFGLYGQATRVISTRKLNALLHLHIAPINQVVYLGPSGALKAREISS